MQHAPTNFKITHTETPGTSINRRFSLAVPSLANLCTATDATSRGSPVHSFWYIDDEGDRIEVTNDADLSEAIRLANLKGAAVKLNWEFIPNPPNPFLNNGTVFGGLGGVHPLDGSLNPAGAHAPATPGHQGAHYQYNEYIDPDTGMNLRQMDMAAAAAERAERERQQWRGGRGGKRFVGGNWRNGGGAYGGADGDWRNGSGVYGGADGGRGFY